MQNRGLALHCHHDKLWEFCWDYNERVKYIKENKTLEEQKLRLKLLFIVPDDKVPGIDSPEWQDCETAWQDCETARQAYDTARQAYVTARQDCETAWKAYETKYEVELEKLHEELCPDCPWNGRTIFTRKNKNGKWY